MENKKNMKAIDILIEALKVYTKTPKFIFFTALATLPLFFFSLYFQNLFKSFIFQASQSLPPENETYHGFSGLVEVYEVLAEYNNITSNSSEFMSDQYNKVPSLSVRVKNGMDWTKPVELVRNLNKDQFQTISLLGFLYLCPFNLLQLVVVILVVDLGSKLYREEKALTLKDMLGVVRFSGERLRGVFVTFLYSVVFSLSTLVGFVWLALTYRAVLGYYPTSFDNFYYFSYINPLNDDTWLRLQYCTNMFLLLGIFLGWGSIWNLSIVISVLEGKYGTKALGSSGYLCLRNVQNGMVLMVVFSMWEMGFTWVPSFLFCSYGGFKSWAVIVAQSGLFCLGNLIKWVGFVVYFDTSIKRLFAKKVDVEEQG